MDRYLDISTATSKTVSENGYQSDEGIILTNNPLIVKGILNCLDNQELLKCKLVCSFWRNIANEIMSKRIIIIKRYVPFEKTRKAVTEPEFTGIYDWDHKGNILVDFNIFDPNRNELEKFTELSVSGYKIKFTNYINNTQIAVFPPFLTRVTRCLFYPDLPHLSFEERITYITESIDKSIKGYKHLKCVLWFADDFSLSYEDVLSKLGVPSLMLSLLDGFYFDPSNKYCGIALSGEGMNVVILKITDEYPFMNIKSKFLNIVEKIKCYKMEPFKCVALLFSNRACCQNQIRNDILHWLREAFPNLPVLLFTDNYLFDIPTYDEKSEEENQLITDCLIRNNDIAVARIVLIWLN